MQKTETTERQDVYTRITAQIVADLEKGVRPWVKPWNAEHAAGRITRPLRHNGQPYSGINILSLWMSATVQNFAAPIWMTFRQALELDAHVRKGEKGWLVVYANSITRTEHDDKTGEDVEREIPYMKGYTVFNVEQIDGLPEIYHAKAESTLDPVARIDHAEKFLHATGAKIAHGGTRAYFSLSTDAVQMPPFESFRDADSYYATLAHELTHWTSSKNRLDRDFGGHCFGSNAYAQEELVAELGAAFLCADLELALEPREDHAAYRRFGEALGIDIKNISPDGGTIKICQKAWRNELHDYLKTDNGGREVDLHPKVAAMLKDFIGERKEGLLFRSKTGKPLSQSNVLRRSLHPVLAKLNQPKCGAHAFRRFRLTWLRKNDVPKDLERFWMGHEDEEIGDRYSKLKQDVEFRQAVAKKIGLGFELPAKNRVVGPNGPKIEFQSAQEMAASA